MAKELKTLAIKEIIERARRSPLNNKQDIANFLKEIPVESNYLIENPFIGNSRVLEPTSSRKSSQTFEKHISLDKLNNNCVLIVSPEQFYTLKSFVI